VRLLVVDDDRDLVELLAFALKRAGFEVVCANDGPSAVQMLETSRPDLMLLDINLGAWSGLDILRELRRGSDLPVIMLTARDREEDVIGGLESGADDYVAKPFSHRQLIARIRAVLRRRGHAWPDDQPAAETLTAGPLTLELAAHRATLDGDPLRLTVTEFRLLQSLMQKPGAVVPTTELLKTVWGFDYPTTSDVVRVTVFRLRRKIESDPANPQLLHTVPGVGFMVAAGTS
jgi:DNA-binding response OmpR family regulator